MPRLAVPAKTKKNSKRNRGSGTDAAISGYLTRVNRDVLLIYPNAGQDVLGINVGLPLSLLYVGTALRHAGVNVTILDERIHADFRPLLISALQKDPLWVGISAMTGYQINHGLLIADTVRRSNPRTPLVWGGVHPTIHPESTARHDLVDIVVIDEGEKTAVDLTNVLAAGGSLNDVRGIAFMSGGKFSKTAERDKVSLDELPELDYSLVNLDDYFTIGHISRTRQLQIVTSRGCPFRCGYCYLTMPGLRGYRWTSAQRVYDELKRLSETYGVRSIFFYDDYFFGNRHRVVEFVELLEEKPLGVQFEVSCRIDYLARESESFLSRLAKVGFTELLIGVESGSDRILKLIKKDYAREQILSANRKMARAGIGSKMSWLAGFPTETAEDFFETVDLMLQLTRQNPYCSLTPLGIYTPYPGTELYERCKTEFGMQFPETLERWAEYQWQKNNNTFLKPEEFNLLTRLNVASRFFDIKLFERFGEKRFRLPIMALYYIYGTMIRMRVRSRFFRLMPEIQLLNWMQERYITSTHRSSQRLRREDLDVRIPEPKRA